jgi:ABC-type bacteriocin/lantibiotic exporter with double-glycine peptidase domain
MWRTTIFPVLTYIVIAVIGQLLIPDELYDMLWLLASGFISLVIWHYVNRRIDRQKNDG